jgi:hypothetical protein
MLDECEVLALPTATLMDILDQGYRSAEPSASAQSHVSVRRLRPRHEIPLLPKLNVKPSVEKVHPCLNAHGQPPRRWAALLGDANSGREAAPGFGRLARRKGRMLAAEKMRATAEAAVAKRKHLKAALAASLERVDTPQFAARRELPSCYRKPFDPDHLGAEIDSLLGRSSIGLPSESFAPHRLRSSHTGIVRAPSGLQLGTSASAPGISLRSSWAGPSSCPRVAPLM